MSCVATKIIAAPWAIVGSIGVIAQLPNFHRLLKKNSIDFEMHTAGAFKELLQLWEKIQTKVERNLNQTSKTCI